MINSPHINILQLPFRENTLTPWAFTISSTITKTRRYIDIHIFCFVLFYLFCFFCFSFLRLFWTKGQSFVRFPFVRFVCHDEAVYFNWQRWPILHLRLRWPIYGYLARLIDRFDERHCGLTTCMLFALNDWIPTEKEEKNARKEERSDAIKTLKVFGSFLRTSISNGITYNLTRTNPWH